MHDPTAALCLVCGNRFPLPATASGPRLTCPGCGATTIELPCGKGVYEDALEQHAVAAPWASEERDELS